MVPQVATSKDSRLRRGGTVVVSGAESELGEALSAALAGMGCRLRRGTHAPPLLGSLAPYALLGAALFGEGGRGWEGVGGGYFVNRL